MTDEAVRRCDACRWWTKKTDYVEPTEGGLGICGRAMPFWEASEWADVGDDYQRVRKDEFKDRRFFAQDGSDYVATVLTGPDFFCADWEVTPDGK